MNALTTAHRTGCPGVVELGRLEERLRTPVQSGAIELAQGENFASRGAIFAHRIAPLAAMRRKPT